MTEIIVPATSANMGPGFDSLGLSVNLFLKIKIGPKSDQWFVHHPFGKEVPSDEQNMIVLSALTVDPNIHPREIFVRSDIPLARGLGSSSSAIVGGLLLGNTLSGSVELSKQQILDRAVKIEGHPDNVAPAIFGGIVIGGPNPIKDDDFWTYQTDSPKNYVPIAVIPHRQLATSASRSVLPKVLDRHIAIKVSAQSNLLVASIFKQDWQKACQLLEADQFHEPYRLKLVPELKIVRSICHAHDIFGSYLSGAGTTIMIMTKKDQADLLLDQLKKSPSLADCDIAALAFDSLGSRILA